MPIQLNQYKIVHYDHAGTALGEVFPEAPEIGIYLSDIGYTTYDIDLSNPMARRDKTEPYVTDYVTYVGTLPIQGGMHTDIQVDDLESDKLNVSGKEWKHYFTRREWDFDPANPVANVYAVFQRDMFDIVRDILGAVMATTDSLVCTYVSPGVLAAELFNYRIDPGDVEKIYDKIDTLAKQELGFDWDISWDKQIGLYAPRKGAYNPNIVLETGKNIHKLTYAERGPDSTQVLGLGTGTSARLGSRQINTAARAKYRRFDNSRDFGSINEQALLDQATIAELAREATPVTSFSCTYIPDVDFDFWANVDVGDIIEVRANTVYDLIEEQHRLVGILSKPTDEGDEEISLTFDDASLSF